MRDKGLSGTCRAALFMPSFRSSRRCPGAFPSRAILKRAGEYRSAAPFLPRPRAAPRPAARSVRTPRPRLFTPAAAPFSLRTFLAARICPIRCADEYRTRAPCSEHRAGRTRRRAATTANCALSPSKGRAPRRRDRKSGAFPAFVRFVPRRKGRHALLLRRASGGAKGCGRGSGRCETGPFLLRGGRYNSTP